MKDANSFSCYVSQEFNSVEQETQVKHKLEVWRNNVLKAFM